MTSIYELKQFSLQNQHPPILLRRPVIDESVKAKTIETPKQMPLLFRKPTTAVSQSVKRKRLQLSPLDENDDPDPVVNSLITALVPALVRALNDNNGANDETNDAIDNANDKDQNVRSDKTE